VVFVVVTNFFFVSLTQNWPLVVLGTMALIGALVLLNHTAPKFSVVVSMSWLGAQTILMAIVLMVFDITELFGYIADLRRGDFGKVG
jgi:hypothetical protein